MPLDPGTRLGPYEIVAAIGSRAASGRLGTTVWDDLRRQLGFGDLSFERGTWWCVPHEEVHHADGSRFGGRKTGGDGRRVVLAAAYGPNATLIQNTKLCSHVCTPKHSRGVFEKFFHSHFFGLMSIVITEFDRAK